MHFIASRTKNYADKRELMNMVNELLGIQYNIAKANRTDRKVQNLAAYINADTLRAIHKTMDRKKAYGIDKVTKEDYEKNLEENLANLVKRMKNGSYRPNPTRRVYIPKETKGKMRPLGISSYEDKLVENAIAQILEQIYEPKFYNESFGFRPCSPVGKGNGWYYYDEGGTMCTGWIEVGGKHYYLYEDGHCAMNEITPDGFRVDADGAWYEAKRELLGQEFPLPAGFQNSISLGDGWGGAQAALNGAAGKISADSGGKRKLLIDSTAIEYKSAVKSAKGDARYMGLYKDSTTGGYRLDIFILLDRNSETQSLGEALDYEVFKAMLTTVSSTPDQLEEAVYSSWQGDNSWNISRAAITSVGDCSVIYEAGQGYGRYYLRPSG